MKYRCFISLSLVSGTFNKMGRINHFHDVVECYQPRIVKPIMCLRNRKWISIPQHNSWRRLRSILRITCLDALFL